MEFEIDEIIERVRKRWSKADETTRRSIASDTRSHTLKLVHDYCTRAEDRQLEHEKDLLGFGDLFECMQGYSVYKYMEEGSKEALLSQYPQLRTIHEQSQKAASLEQYRKTSIKMSWTTWAGEDSPAPEIASQLENLDRLMKGRSNNWLLQLSKISRKVNREVAERIILMVLASSKQQVPMVIASALQKVYSIIYTRLLEHGWDGSCHQTVPYSEAEQARNSNNLLKEAEPMPKHIRLDECWNVIYEKVLTDNKRRRERRV